MNRNDEPAILITVRKYPQTKRQAVHQNPRFHSGSIKFKKCLLRSMMLLCISIYPILTHAQQNDLPPIPPGQLIKASLLNTIDSGAATPVIGVVSEDVWCNGNKIIPAHSEIHGLSQADALRDRIACNDRFVIVWRNGTVLRELQVQGTVLDRDDTQSGKGLWGVTDGSCGMKGKILTGACVREGKIMNEAFVRVPSGHTFYLYAQTITIQPKS